MNIRWCVPRPFAAATLAVAILLTIFSLHATPANAAEAGIDG